MARTFSLPDQTGNSWKVLWTDGSVVSWGEASGWATWPIGYTWPTGYTWYTWTAGTVSWWQTLTAWSWVWLTMSSTDLGGWNAINSFSHTASGTLTANTTTQETTAISRTYTLTSGSVTDNFIGSLFSRTNVTTWAGGTLLAQWSVVSITWTDTQTAGTLTPSYDLLSLIPSLRSTGSSIKIAVPNSIVTAPTTAHFSMTLGNTQTVQQKLMDLNTWTSDVFWTNQIALNINSTVSSWNYIWLENIQAYQSATQPTRSWSIWSIWLSMWQNFWTNSANSTMKLYIQNMQNAGAWYNTGILIDNFSTDFDDGSLWIRRWPWISINQSSWAGTCLSVFGSANVNSSTNWLVNFSLYTSQSWSSVMQKIDLGLTAQAHIWSLVQAYWASTTQKAFSALLSSTGTGIAYHATSSSLSWAWQLQSLIHTASGTLTANTTNQSTIQSSRTYTLTSGSVTDNYNIQYLLRTNITTGAGGTLLAQWSVLKLENVATQTAGTLTDTVTVLNVVQDTDSTGDIFGAYAWATKKFSISSTWDTTPVWRMILPMAEASYFNTTGTAITISAQSDGSTNMVVVAPTTTFSNDSWFDNGGWNTWRIRYTGATTKTFHCAITFTGAPATANDEFVFWVAKNGTTMAGCKVLQKFGTSTDSQAIAIHCMVSLATNDYIELYVGNITASRNVTVKSLNVFAMWM